MHPVWPYIVAHQLYMLMTLQTLQVCGFFFGGIYYILSILDLETMEECKIRQEAVKVPLVYWLLITSVWNIMYLQWLTAYRLKKRDYFTIVTQPSGEYFRISYNYCSKNNDLKWQTKMLTWFGLIINIPFVILYDNCTLRI